MSYLGQKQPPTQACALWILLTEPLWRQGRTHKPQPEQRRCWQSLRRTPRGLPAGLSSSPSPRLRTPTPANHCRTWCTRGLASRAGSFPLPHPGTQPVNPEPSHSALVLGSRAGLAGRRLPPLLFGFHGDSVLVLKGGGGGWDPRAWFYPGCHGRSGCQRAGGARGRGETRWGPDRPCRLGV